MAEGGRDVSKYNTQTQIILQIHTMHFYILLNHKHDIIILHIKCDVLNTFEFILQSITCKTHMTKMQTSLFK